MSTSVILLSVLLFITSGRAWNDGPDWNPWNDINPRYPEPYYDFDQPDQPFADADFYPEYHSEGRTRPPSTPALYPLFKNDQVDNKGRFIGTAFLASVLQPFPNLANRLPFIANPNFVGPVRRIYNCNGSSGETGICASRLGCSLSGGERRGNCPFPLGVCCINVIKTCDGTAAINNTYWTSPTGLNTTCALTVAPITLPAVQPKPICQIRLDFVSFTIGQPTVGDCLDTFEVVGDGLINQGPIICGENSGQHMYIEISPTSAITTSSSSVQLLFTFGAPASTPRSWNIKISMLPCGASYLAPSDCLQYFTSATGRVSSFNWQNVAVGGVTRQLNNQQYNICFRNELIDSQRTTQMCLQICTPIVAEADAFSLSGTATDDTTSNSGTVLDTGCVNDFILFMGGTNNLVSADRFCGSALNPTAAAVSVAVCSTIRPFRITYVTSVDEVTAPADANNQGFCLTFQQTVQ